MLVRKSLTIYAVSLLVVAVAIGIRLLLDPLLGTRNPLFTLFLGVVFMAWLGGSGPAWVTLIVGSIAATYFLLDPRHTFPLGQLEHQLALLLFYVACFATIMLFESLRKARERIAEKSEWLRATLASIGDGVITIDRDSRITSMNAVAATLTGWTENEAQGQPLETVFRIVNESTRQPVENPALRALKEGVIVGLANHTVLIAQDGTERPIDDSAAPIRSKDGYVVGCVLVFRDITERRRLELQNSERAAAARILASVVESSEDAIISKSLDGTIRSWNASAQRLFGYPAEQAIGRNISLLIPADRTEEETHILAQLRAGKRIEAYDTVRTRSDGRLVHVSLTISPIRDEAGQVIGASKIVRDITDRKRIEMEIRAAQQQLATTLESVTDGFIRYDRDWRIIYVNGQAERMNHLTRDQMLGKTPWELFPDAVGTKLETELRRAVAEQVTIEFENYYEPFDRWFSIKGYPTADGGLTAYIRDITEQKVHQQAVAKSEARFRRMFESNVVGMIRWDLDRSLILDANDAFLRMTGYTRDDVAAGRLNFRDMTPAEWTSRNEEGIRAIRADGHAVPYEKEYFRRDGSRVQLIIAGTKFEDSPSEGMSLLIDISEQKRAEQEIARLASESERQRRLYETVLTNTPDFMYVFSLDHKVLYANDALIKMWGRGYDGAIGKTFLEIGYEPWHAEMHDREIDQVRATRQPIRGEVPFTGTSGRRQYEYIFVPVIGADGEVEAVAGTTRDVTERNETERQLRESEERSAFVRRSSGVGFWYCDLPFDVLQWDELVKTHFHLPPDAVVTIRTFYDRLHPDDRVPTHRAIEQSIADRTPYNVVYRTVSPDTGAMKWVRAIGRTFYAADGTPIRFDGVTFDVSDQKRAEERQAFLIRLADTLRPLDEPTDVQAEASRVLGEYLGANRVVYFEIRDDEYVIERDYTAGVQPLAGRYPVATFGPALLTVLLEGRTIIEADATTEPDRPPDERAAFGAIQVRGHVDVPLVKGGRFVAGMTVQVSDRRDWTRQEVALIEETAERTWSAVERVRAERELARLAAEADRERRLFAAVLSNAPDFIYTFDLDGRFVYVNAALLSLWGRRLNEAVGRNFFDLEYPPPLADRLQRQIQQVIDTKQPLRDETPYTSGWGERMYEYIFAPVIGEDGAVEAVVGSTRDITDRKLIEAERERLLVELRDQDRRKDEFLATLAHELRNPLAPVRNSLELMKHATNMNLVHQSRTVMERQVGQMVRLIDDLLDVSRITRDKLMLKLERVELASIVHHAVEACSPLYQSAGHELTVTLPTEPIYLNADPMRLAQVFGNLLNNSCKYTRQGGKVWLTAERQGTSVVVKVKDTGIGIPPEMLPTVFNLFTQVHGSLEQSEGGLGIGLSLVKRLAEMHGGSVTAASEGPGKGSEFVVALPLLTEIPKPAAPSEPIDQSVQKKSRRVLVVDDNRDSADSLAMLVNLMGNETQIAHDGVEAVEKASSFRPELILLDIGLPKMNGYEACRKIREQPWGQSITMVALTGWGQEEDRRKSQEAGFNGHLVKPIELAELERLLKSS